MRIDPRILRQIAPEAPPQPLPGPPEPERVVKELPNAPQPQPNVAQPAPQPSAPAPKTDIQRPPVKLETPDQQETQHGLLLPKSSPGKSIQESVREAARNSGRSGAISGPMPSSRGAPGGGGAPSQGLMTNGYELLTPTEGVDFSNYLARVLASVRQNWYAVIPESARLGDRGRVVLQFRIMRPGDVPVGEPALLLTSGKEPLDRAALSAIRTSSPFEPLPPAFSGPFIELRFIFLYNLPLSEAQ
jgi:outer membrane biosynthesis protein TonB